MDSKEKFVVFILIFNCVIGITDRVLQIFYYAFTRWSSSFEISDPGLFDKKGGFVTEQARKTALTFCILPTALNLFMITIYTFLHYEVLLTPKVKLKNFFLYLLGTEFLCPISVNISFKNKYSKNVDSPILTMKLINAIHFMLVSLPQLLIISINSTARESFKGLDIASLIFSTLFMIWSIVYYFLCIIRKDDFDDYIYYKTYPEVPKNN